MRDWCDQQCQLWRDTWSLAKQRMLVLVSWYLAVTVVISLVLILWQFLVEQFHVAGFSLPAMVWRVLVVLVIAEYAMTVLTLMLGKPGEPGLAIDHCLQKSTALFIYVLLLRCLMWLAIAVASMLLLVPGFLLAVFCSFVMSDVLQHDIKGMFALQRTMRLWHGYRWRIIRMCAPGYGLVLALVAVTVWLWAKDVSADVVVTSLMLLLISAVIVRCMQVVVVAQVHQLMVQKSDAKTDDVAALGV